jgi:hypothetical protein
MCTHDLGTAISRYDRRRRKLRSVLVCDSCGREIRKLGKAQTYKPAYQPHSVDMGRA